MLDKEFKYYRDHQDELVKKHKNKYIVIVGKAVVGAHDTRQDAYNATIKNHKEGTFLIQLCAPGKESYTRVFHSRIAV